jgi:AraC family transcriptional regulator of adaptative response / DNA-3-methyladenine glycosylase II
MLSENGQTAAARGATVRAMGTDIAAELDPRRCYEAVRARDSRFDGCFFVGVSTTGIYCRPVCTVRTPGRDRCTYYATPAAAESAGFRPCLRCRPEIAPRVAAGVAPVDALRASAHWLAARIEAGALNDRDLDTLAGEYGLSSRQMRRALLAEYGVTPIELAQTRRLLLAKQLLTDTALPMARVAHASGFSSVRRFNALFKTRYRLSPGALRRRGVERSGAGLAAPATVRLRLGYRPPLAWDVLCGWLVARGATGVEAMQPTPGGARYVRSVTLEGAPGELHRGWFAVAPAPAHAVLDVEVSESLLPVLTPLLARIRRVFDLDANPLVIDAHLQCDAALRPLLARRPGLRVPGGFDGFELALRAVLGQQISVKAATTLFGRFAATFGEPAVTPFAALTLHSPSADRIAAAGTARIAALGLTRQRAATVWTLARAVAAGDVTFAAGVPPETVLESLRALPGIGPWTAQYVAMRALGVTDAFPSGDLGLMKALRLDKPARLVERAERWRPWRAYAALHLWTELSSGG